MVRRVPHCRAEMVVGRISRIADSRKNSDIICDWASRLVLALDRIVLILSFSLQHAVVIFGIFCVDRIFLFAVGSFEKDELVLCACVCVS